MRVPLKKIHTPIFIISEHEILTCHSYQSAFTCIWKKGLIYTYVSESIYVPKRENAEIHVKIETGLRAKKRKG